MESRPTEVYSMSWNAYLVQVWHQPVVVLLDDAIKTLIVLADVFEINDERSLIGLPQKSELLPILKPAISLVSVR